MTSYLKMVTVQEKAMCIVRFSETKSVTKMERSYRTRYRRDPPSDNANRRWLKQFREAGNVLHLKETERPSTSQEVVNRIQEAFS
jgi:hypothetical protein